MSEMYKAMRWAAFREGGGRTVTEEEAAAMATALVTPTRPIANLMDPEAGRKNHPKRRPRRGKPKQKPEKPDKGG